MRQIGWIQLRHMRRKIQYLLNEKKSTIPNTMMPPEDGNNALHRRNVEILSNLVKEKSLCMFYYVWQHAYDIFEVLIIIKCSKDVKST